VEKSELSTVLTEVARVFHRDIDRVKNGLIIIDGL
jgi:hypothetical protein